MAGVSRALAGGPERARAAPRGARPHPWLAVARRFGVAAATPIFAAMRVPGADRVLDAFRVRPPGPADGGLDGRELLLGLGREGAHKVGTIDLTTR